VRRVADGVDTDTAADWVIGDFGNGTDNTPTPGAVPPSGPCEGDPVLISTIQGSGASSSCIGETVTISGIVVGDFETSAALRGFYVQEENADSDGDAATSEGIFVFSGSSGFGVSEGDLVEVTGDVAEFRGETQIGFPDSVVIVSSGNVVEPTEVTLPFADADYLERYEGMLVTFPQTLTISEFFNFDRFGEIVLTTDRQFQPTNVAEPGSAEALAIAAANPLARITLDDGRSSQNPDPAIHPNGADFTLTNYFRGGDTVANVTGALSYSFGAYKIQPTQGADYTSVNPRPLSPSDVGGSVKVATFNVLNFFTNLDDGENDICGPTGDLECRGADNATERQRQLDKLVAGIVAMGADVVGLQEIENDIRTDDPNGRAHDPILTLVEALNAVEGAGTWAWVGEASYYNDYPVRNDILYRPDTVTPMGQAIALQSDAFDLVRPGSTEPVGRPPVAQTFVDNTGAVFTVVVNHFKSKGSSCSSIGDPSDPLGQGNCNGTRVAQSAALLGFVADLQVASNDADVLINGDLNSYAKEDPIAALEAGGFTNLLGLFQGEYAYTYVFDGQLGYLDHSLANASLLPQVTGTTAWAINADEADIFDYDTSFKKPAQDALYEPLPYRVSDHDPVISGLDLDVTIEQALERLTYVVEMYGDDGVINKGQYNALTRHLKAISRSIDRGRDNAAMGQIMGWISQVEDLVADGVLTEFEGMLLTIPAEALYDLLS
jgi:predicted extracellular nuclease